MITKKLLEMLTEEQLQWIEDYETETTFDCLWLDMLESGEYTFEKFAQLNCDWFEDYSSDALRTIGHYPKSEEYWNSL